MDTKKQNFDNSSQFLYPFIKKEANASTKNFTETNFLDCFNQLDLRTKSLTERQKFMLVAQFVQSNLTIAEFSNLYGLIPATFRNWAIKYNQEVKVALGIYDSQCPTISETLESFSNNEDTLNDNDIKEEENSIEPIDITDKLKSYLNQPIDKKDDGFVSLKINGFNIQVDYDGLKSLLEVIKNV